MEERPRLLILYASQTGNAMDAAERIGREAERGGCLAVVLSMDEFDASLLQYEETVIFIVSTTGQGDTPDSMKEFWRFLLQRNLSHQWLEGLYYAVFGLGDSGYQKYNFAAKKLDKRLADLGASPIIERGLGDDQHPSGYEGALDPWLSSLWKTLKETSPIFSRVLQITDLNVRTLGHPKCEIIYHTAAEVLLLSSTTLDFESIEMKIWRARSMSPGIIRRDESRPQFFLQMTKNQLLTKPGCGREVCHFELESLSSVSRYPCLSSWTMDLLAERLDYHIGDALEVLPAQDPALVDAFIQRCNLNPDMLITVQMRDGKECDPGYPVNSSRDPVKLRTFVELTMDIASASPRRYFFEVMSFFANAEHEKEKLQFFASAEGREDLYQYNQKERRTVLEVLEDFPSVQMPFEWLVELVPPLQKRAFSISSSPLAHPGEVHLTVSVVSWTTPFKRQRLGLCSTWLAGLDPDKKVLIPAWIHRSSAPPPSPSVPLILIGPGTGCAPFRAFVEERAVQGASGPTAPILFFFGCRNKDNDFLYRDFWLSHTHGSGVLSEEKGGGFFVAFSRDQPQKIYVQHKMQEQSQRIWNLLSEGASIFIAGSSMKMPADVSSCLEEIISKANGDSKAASRWLRMLEKHGRYNVETWS